MEEKLDAAIAGLGARLSASPAPASPPTDARCGGAAAAAAAAPADDATARLSAEGYAVVDGVWGGELAAALRREVLALHHGKHMARNSVAFLVNTGNGGGSGGGGGGGGQTKVELDKPHVFEADMHNAGMRSRAALFRRMFRSAGRLARALNSAVPAAALDEGRAAEEGEAGAGAGAGSGGGGGGGRGSPAPLLDAQGMMTVKLQLNEGGGGCFPWHYDNPAKP